MRSLDWTIADVATATAGIFVGDGATAVSGVSTDSRSVCAGDLFVAIAGEHFDGHDFVAAAGAAGASASLVGSGRSSAEPRVEVVDTVAALRDLAAQHRASLRQPFVAVTGSTGKTTTKDMLAAALPGAWASPRSFNNEIGVPLTVLGTPRNAGFAVIEVGSRRLGDIDWLVPAVEPDVAIITNIGNVHFETFGSTDNVVAAKFELVEALGAEGVAVLPADEPRLVDRAHGATMATFGVDVEATVTAHDVLLDEGGLPTFTLDTPVGSCRVTVPIPGAFQAVNAAATVTAGLALHVPLDTLVAGLATVEGSAWRMEVHRGRYAVVNDAYNANPRSVEAALRTVVAMPGRHVAVLGQMAELGLVSESEHRRIGRLARELGFARVIVVGNASQLADGAGDIAHRVPDADAAVAAALDELTDGDVVLVKASRSVGLEAVAEPLIVASRVEHS